MTNNLMPKQKLSSEHLADHYKLAGVDTDEADAGLKRLTHRIKENWPPANDPNGGVQLDVGYFANVVNISGIGIAITTDGIGSKAKIASMLGKYDTVGIDCVAMNVNDLICVGAKPVSMVDYLAVESVSADMVDAISVGLYEGAKQADITITGGETAQLKGMIHGFDLAGTAIGHVDLNQILIGQDIRDGDVIIGVESNGIHSNGLTLARRAFFENGHFKIGHWFDEFECTLGEELLRPTHIYVREAMRTLAAVKSLRALVHITSDGFLNLTRVKRNVSFLIDRLPPIPPIFSLIEKYADVEREEMFSVFNMGIGLCAIVGCDEVEEALSKLESGGRRAHVIGRVLDDGQRNVHLPQFHISGHGKHFNRV